MTAAWQEFLRWFGPFALVILALVVVSSVLRFREWLDEKHERAEQERAEAFADALANRVLDRRSSRVRAVEALTGAIEVIAVPVDAKIIAVAPQSPDPEAAVLA